MPDRELHSTGTLVACLVALSISVASAAPPTNNAVATFYAGDEGYPAWTDRIRWSNAIDMSKYAKGRAAFEKFENARDELAARGGGVLYYPAGTYDFSDGPFDGLGGCGLMLKSGVVIRGEAPAGRPIAARDGKLHLVTKFVFGMQKRGGHDVPRDWNLIGLAPEAGKGPASVRNVGIAWVHLVGAVVYFGPDLKWGETWATAKSWKSAYAKDAWRSRKPDGTHPGDPFLGAPGGADGAYVPGARGRLVFGCVIERGAVLNDYDTCGRAEFRGGFGEEGFHMAKFGARVAVYGSRVLVANNVLARADKGNFLYRQATVETIARNGNEFKIGTNRVSTVMWDYNRTMGLDINKDLLGLVRAGLLETRRGGYFEEGVVIRDNWVFNHGHKGYNLSGKWCTIRDNRNERMFLKGGAPVLGVKAGWRLTLDGFTESCAGGGGMISDNLARAFDLAGEGMWIHGNTWNNTGSDPGNDGEGICCQAHGGTDIASWAITHNRRDRDSGGDDGWIGGWAVRCRGLLVAWNESHGFAGAFGPAKGSGNIAVVANRSARVHPDPGEIAGKGLQNILIAQEGQPFAPRITDVELYEGDAVRIAWQDLSGFLGPDGKGRHPLANNAATGEIGFRVDRRMDDGAWHTIAYRPPQMQPDELNPPEWIDFLAPRGRKLTYRVAAISADDSDAGVSTVSEAIVLLAGKRERWADDVPGSAGTAGGLATECRSPSRAIASTCAAVTDLSGWGRNMDVKNREKL